jgi:hypothetical protein
MLGEKLQVPDDPLLDLAELGLQVLEHGRVAAHPAARSAGCRWLDVA